MSHMHDPSLRPNHTGHMTRLETYQSIKTGVSSIKKDVKLETHVSRMETCELGMGTYV